MSGVAEKRDHCEIDPPLWIIPGNFELFFYIMKHN